MLCGVYVVEWTKINEAIWRDDSKYDKIMANKCYVTLLQIEEHSQLYPEVMKQVEEHVWNYKWTTRNP